MLKMDNSSNKNTEIEIHKYGDYLTIFNQLILNL